MGSHPAIFDDMSNLVPEQRADKNGRTVTRWVKPQGTSGAAASIPAPQSNVGTIAYEKKCASVANSISSRLYLALSHSAEQDGVRPALTSEEIFDAISGFDYETLTVIQDNFPPADETAFLTQLIGEGSSEREFKNAMFFRDCFDEYEDADRVVSVTNGLSHYDAFAPDTDLTELEGDRLEAARSLCKVTDGIFYGIPGNKSPLSAYPGTREYRHITDNDLVEAVIDHPHRSEEIIQFIIERENADGKLIRQYLDSESPALSQGEL